MKRHEEIAIGHYLTNWPEEKTFEEIIHLLETDNCDDIDVWEPFENYDREEIARMIRDLAGTTELADPPIVPELLRALKLAVHALNRVPNFKVNCIDTNIKDSYQIAAICDKAIARAEG